MCESLFPTGPIGTLIASQTGGGTPPRQNPAYWTGPIPWASVKDFDERKIELLDTDEKISPQGLSSSATNLIPANTPIVCTRMAVGRVAVAPMDVAINQDLKALFPARSTDTRYLLRLADYAKPKAEAVSVGSTVKGIKVADYLNIEVPLAPPSQQSKIAEVLDTLDAAIRGTEAVVEKLKAMKQGLLHDLLTRGIDANGDLRPPQPEAPHLYKQTPLGWLPKGWDVDHLSSFASVHGGKRLLAGHAYANGGTAFKYLRVTDFFDKTVKIDDLENLEEHTFRALERYEITAGHLYISIAGSLGYVGVFPDSPDGLIRTILTENAARIVLQKSGNPEFLSIMMNSAAVQQQVEWEKGTGGGVPKLALFRIAQFYIGFPSPEEQDAITQAYREIGERGDREQKLLDKLRLLKSGLMDDLLTGRTPVTPLL